MTQTILEQAICTAVVAHIGQVDKTGVASILHSLAVMQMFPGDYTRQVIAVLHDVVEDTTVTLDDLRTVFSSDIVDALDALTRRKSDGETYKDFIRRCAQNELAKPVKIADVQHNFYRLTPEIEELSKRYTWALLYLINGMELD